ncbi:MAG: tungstate ABC transporter substrate-binding protein WtpA [Candidatus Aerophobetes bacterium]|nr:tungstate ABC transporter substrate-binding protein WtpA [Candidatus Aerophobetes bacterium]
MRGILMIISILIGSTLVFTNLASAEEISGKVIIFHAGSLAVPFVQMEKEFEAIYPEVDILRESAGSRRCARKIIELDRESDIIASSDVTVIDTLLIPEFADWDIHFANNQLVLCYAEESRYADKINKDNWYEILIKEGVQCGHSDPNVDPCGYRAVMVMQLAEKYYKIPSLFKKLQASIPQRNIRPKSVELIALLEAGALDYAFEYRSVAVQHNLKFVELPPQINLSSAEYDDFYRNASVKVRGKEPGTFITKRGASITYGVTLLRNAPHRRGAIKFLKYLLDSEKGLKVLKQSGQPPIIPPIARFNVDKIPEELQSIVK